MIGTSDFDFVPIQFLNFRGDHRILTILVSSHSLSSAWVGFPLLGNLVLQIIFLRGLLRSDQLDLKIECEHFALALKWLLTPGVEQDLIPALPHQYRYCCNLGQCLPTLLYDFSSFCSLNYSVCFTMGLLISTDCN